MSTTLMYIFFRLLLEDGRPVAASNVTKVKVYPSGQMSVLLFGDREEILYEKGEWGDLTTQPMEQKYHADVERISIEHGPIEKTGWQHGRATN